MVSGGRSVSTGASASAQVSLDSPSSGSPSCLRTVLWPPSQPTSQGTSYSSAVPSGCSSSARTRSASCSNEASRTPHSTVTPSRATASRSTASVSVWAMIRLYGKRVGIDA